MRVTEIVEGLWRWTAPHPAWRPEKGGAGGWEREVASLYFEIASDAGAGIALFDPQVPPDGSPDASRFWQALDRDVDRCGGRVAVLIGNAFHGRSCAEIYRRYSGGAGVDVWVPPAAPAALAELATGTLEEGTVLPGVEAFAVQGSEPSETAFWLPGPAALVFADAVIGSGAGEVRVAPGSWAPEGPEAAREYERSFRPSLARLLALDPALLLPSHGEPVLEGGRAALERALAAPAWGDG